MIKKWGSPSPIKAFSLVLHLKGLGIAGFIGLSRGADVVAVGGRSVAGTVPRSTAAGAAHTEAL